MNEQWKPLSHNKIQDGYCLSSYGRIRYEDNDPYEPEYHSSNGYDYSLFGLCREGNDIIQHQLFPIDDLIGMTFIPVPNELENKPIKIIHIDGDNRNNHISNLKWVEDIEEWKEVTYPEVVSGMYEISSWGRIRNKLTMTIMKPSVSSKGYEQITLRTNTGVKHTGLHRVLMCSHRPIDEWMTLQVNHIDGIKTHNHWKNLEWCDNSYNQKHAYALDLNFSHHTLTDDVVVHVWRLLIDDISAINKRTPTKGSPTLVKKYLLCDMGINVPIGIIKSIKAKECYRKITDRLDQRPFEDLRGRSSATKLNEDIVKTIWMMLIDDPLYVGNTRTFGSPNRVYSLLVDKGIYGVSVDDISAIKLKRNWTGVTDSLPQSTFNDCRGMSHSKLSKELVILIWLLLVDDPTSLDGEEPTNGSISMVKNILDKRGYDVKTSTIDAIKRKTNYKKLTDTLVQKEFPKLK